MTVHFRRTSVMPSADAAVRQQSLRSHNLALVFRQVVESGEHPISRAQIAAATGLTRPTVSRIVDQLISGRLVVELGPAAHAGLGRPPVGLALSREGPAGLGLGVKAGQLSACLVDLTGAVRHLDVVDIGTDDWSAERVISDLARMAGEAVSLATQQRMSVAGVMLAVPGLVQDHRWIRHAPTLGWRDVAIAELLRPLVCDGTVAVAVDNEANLAALGEFYADEDLSDFVYISGEMEVGAGTFLNGQLLRGIRGWSGQLGHLTIYPDGRRCRCGAQGCLQAYAGLEVLARAEPTAAGPVGSTEIVARADAGSPATLTALETAGTALGIAIANVVNYVDVDRVVLGGSYSVLSSWLLEGVRTQVEQRVFTSNWSPVEVRPSLLGSDAAVIGAALTVIDEIRQCPPDWLLDEN